MKFQLLILIFMMIVFYDKFTYYSIKEITWRDFQSYILNNNYNLSLVEIDYNDYTSNIYFHVKLFSLKYHVVLYFSFTVFDYNI